MKQSKPFCLPMALVSHFTTGLEVSSLNPNNSSGKRQGAAPANDDEALCELLRVGEGVRAQLGLEALRAHEQLVPDHLQQTLRQLARVRRLTREPGRRNKAFIQHLQWSVGTSI